MRMRMIVCAGALLLLAVFVSGCAPQRVHEKDWPEPRTTDERPGPAPLDPPPSDSTGDVRVPDVAVATPDAAAQGAGAGTPNTAAPNAGTQGATPDVAVKPDAVPTAKTTVTSVSPPLRSRLSDEDKQSIIEASLINLQRMFVNADEKLVLSTGTQESTAARDAMVTKLAELQFDVIQTTETLPFTPSEAEQDAFRRKNDVNLVFLLQAEAAKADKFGNFWSYQGKAQGKVLNLTTRQVVTSKTITKRGRRALDEAEAAEDALAAAAKDLNTYLTDEVVRKWEYTSLVRMILEVNNVDTISQADDLRVGLQRRVGVFYVSLESWDYESQKAVLEVLCRFDVQRFLVAYVEELREGGLKLRWVRSGGEAIKAKRKARQ